MSKNPWIGVNYIADNERMPVPPPFFLARLYDQDAMLVIIPSRATPGAYVIARRKQFGPGLTEAAIDAQYGHPDTKMCVMNGCVPVCMMLKNGPGWDIDAIIRSLQARDIWAHGGADAVADMLEEQEEAEREKIRQQIRDDMYNRSGDAWRSYQHRTGQTTIRSKDFLPAKTANGAADQNSSSGSTVGSDSGLSNSVLP